MTLAPVIGVDVGGTKIDTVVMTAQGDILAEHRVATNPVDGVSAVLDRIADSIRQLTRDYTISAIGIGSPGHVDSTTGIVHLAVNLGWRDVGLREGLHDRLGASLPITIRNDVHAALLGEVMFGAAKGARNVVYAAVGTGLGGAALVNGEIVSGDNAFAMELGHLSLVPDGRLCGCGRRGCAEMYASGTGVLAAVREYAPTSPDSLLIDGQGETTTAAVLTAARAGDPLAARVMAEAGMMLGRALASCAMVLNPSLFVIGGGLGMVASDLLVPAVRHELAARVLPPLYERAQVVVAQNARIAIGSACIALQSLLQHSA